MAERRMFAKTIVTSDSFLDMPLSSRCLYFSLGMLADDDGFVNNPKSVMRQVRASLDDFNLLLAKHFIIAFDSGIIVIKHWKIHSYIPKDRYKATKYINEKSSLLVDEKGAYIEKKAAVYTLDAQDRKESELVQDSFFLSIAREQGQIVLSNEEADILSQKISEEDLRHYVEAIISCEESGKKYKKKTHFQAIVDMAKEDGKYDKPLKSYDLDDFFESALVRSMEDLK